MRAAVIGNRSLWMRSAAGRKRRGDGTVVGVCGGPLAALQLLPVGSATRVAPPNPCCFSGPQRPIPGLHAIHAHHLFIWPSNLWNRPSRGPDRRLASWWVYRIWTRDLDLLALTNTHRDPRRAIGYRISLHVCTKTSKSTPLTNNQPRNPQKPERIFVRDSPRDLDSGGLQMESVAEYRFLTSPQARPPVSACAGREEREREAIGAAAKSRADDR